MFIIKFIFWRYLEQRLAPLEKVLRIPRDVFNPG